MRNRSLGDQKSSKSVLKISDLIIDREAVIKPAYVPFERIEIEADDNPYAKNNHKLRV